MWTLEMHKNDKLVHGVDWIHMSLSATLWVPLSGELSVVVQSFSRVRLFVTPWTLAHQGPLSMGFSRQEYWSGLPFSFPGDLPEPEIKLTSPTLAGRFFTPELPGKHPRQPKVIGLLSVYSVEAEIETTASSLHPLSTDRVGSSPLSAITPHQTSSGQHFSTGTTGKAIFIYSA